ncbi:MAG: NAD-dependent epimerase/dehydratase family protein [Thermoguttaceae bacterium]
MPNCSDLPESIRDLEQLDELLSRPTAEVVETLGRIEGDILVLGVGGKIGPSLARMARRASDAAGRGTREAGRRRILGAARFSEPGLQDRLESQGIETIRCDLLDRAQLAGLPEMPNVFYLAAMKFGATGQEPATWARNAYLPGLVCERFPASRIVAYSTGNVYPLVPPARGGSRETDPPGPVGDYAMSCLGRERILTYFSQTRGTPVALLRLYYAHEMRYGVLVDLAGKIADGRSVDLAMGYFNAIWQGDSNAMTLRALDCAASPPRVVNLAGRQALAVRRVAAELGRLLDRPVRFTGSEAADALLANTELACRLFGPPQISEEQIIRWVADWHRRGGPTHGKPTHFETRDGKF